MESKTWKNALITGKAIKDKNNGGQFMSLEIKQNPNDKYPKSFSWFYTEEDTEIMKEVKKNCVVDITFIEKPGVNKAGAPCVYRNIETISVTGELEQSEIKEKVEAKKVTPEEEIKEMVSYVTEIAKEVKETWITNFLSDERLKDIPKQEMVSIFSTMFIQTCRSIE